MNRILLRIRPLETMNDLNLELIQKRASSLADWSARVSDTRLSDAPYISMTIDLPEVSEDELVRLKEALLGMPRMPVYLWMGRKREMALDLVDVKALDEAARSLAELV